MYTIKTTVIMNGEEVTDVKENISFKNIVPHLSFYVIGKEIYDGANLTIYKDDILCKPLLDREIDIMRKRRAMTQKEIAEQIGVSISRIGQIEKRIRRKLRVA